MRRVTLSSKALNLLMAPAAGGRKRPAQTWQQAVAKVVERSGYSTAGEDVFITELGFLLECLAAEPRLTPLGWQSALADAAQRLENRLRINDLVAKHPAILEERVAKPVFVVGLPRTATTLAHKVLAASDDHRGPLLWEMFHTDLPGDPNAEARRVATMGRQAKVMTRIAPSWEVIHPIRVDSPEESMFLLPHGTYHLILRAAMPEYRAWLKSRDTVPDYEYLKRALQVLQHGRERKRWILKYPAHLSDLDVIRKVFPDATFVWTHRDPTTAIGSLCSLMETSWSTFQSRPDLDDIGRLAVELLAESVDRGRDSRVTLPPQAIVDVPYHLLNSDPQTQVPRLYRELGARWTDKDAGNLENVLARPAADRRHEYGVGRYGLTLEHIEATFGDYMRLVSSFNR